jgi:2'-hydroxyisoflavone reductase
MKLLILGGTKFVGRHLVQSALKQGFEITLFNRGQTNPDLFPEVEHLKGDRDGDMSALAGRTWDVVVDTCGYVPRIVKYGASKLVGKTGLYIFISSISVYDDFLQPNNEESHALKIIDDPVTEIVDVKTYGALKALCEQAVIEAFGDKAMIVRPGVIVGPYDNTDRFTYWPAIIGEGGNVIAPGDKNSLVQFIDARDLCDWLVGTMTKPVVGVFNTIGPQAPLTMLDFLNCCQSTLNSNVELHWLAEAFLLSNDVKEWDKMPLWLPVRDPDNLGFMQCNSERAIAQGLKFRPLTQTINDTWQWHLTRSPAYEWQAGLSKARAQ